MFTNNSIEVENKVDAVKQIFESSGSAEATKNAIEDYTKKAFLVLESLHISDDKKSLLKTFGNSLMSREV